MSSFDASLIISVYNDTTKLNCILEAIKRQSINSFEIIVSEDGESPEMASLVATHSSKRLQHLTQEDRGFRKNKALNRAIAAARSDYLIFIDGDCVPHQAFVANHVHHAQNNAVGAGRRVELGPLFSHRVLENPAYLQKFENPFLYLRLATGLHQDGVKNFEYGFYSPVLHWLSRSRPIHIVGCNFSCSRSMLEKVNGFDEAYESPGIGEDSDIEWRLRSAGYRINNLKFVTPLYHLHHARAYSVSARNKELFDRRKASGEYRCVHGMEVQRRESVT